jgi:hypothetical protein
MIPKVRAHTAHMRDVLAWRDVRMMLSLFCIFQIMDGITTTIALASHNFQEENPLLGNVLDSYPLAAMGVKVGVAAVVVVAILAVRLRWRMRLAVMTLFVIASLAAPLVNLLRITGLA